MTDPGDYSRGADLPNAIAPMPDGGVVVGGQLELPKYTSTYNSQSSGALVRYDRRGAIVWQTLLQQDNGDGSMLARNVVSFVHTDASGNIFVIGGIGNNGNLGRYPFVAKFAPGGTKAWQGDISSLSYIAGYDGNGQPIIHPGTLNSPTAMELTDDGGVIVGSSLYDGHFENIYPMILKINADGSVGIHRTYLSNNQYSSVHGCCPAVGGQGYVLNLSPYGQTGPESTVILTDADGSPISQRTFSVSGSSPCLTGDFITRDTNGGYLPLGAANGDGEVIKLKADLTPVWSKLINRPDNVATFAPTLVALPGGGCLLGAQTAKPGGGPQSNAVLLTLDGDGTLVSTHLLGSKTGGEGVSGTPSFEGRPVTARLTTDGGIGFTVATFGYATDNPTKADWWVVRADANGKVIGFPDNTADLPQNGVSSNIVDQTAQTSVVTSDYGPPAAYETGTFTGSSGPALVPEDLATETGFNVPTIKFQAAPAKSYNHVVFFGGESALNDGVYYLKFPSGNPFGYYTHLTDPSFVYHFGLGYECVFDADDLGHGAYLHDFKSDGFFYTSPAFPFPYLYDFSLNTVLYYYPDPNNPDRYNTNGIRYFYEFANGQIIGK